MWVWVWVICVRWRVGEFVDSCSLGVSSIYWQILLRNANTSYRYYLQLNTNPQRHIPISKPKLV